MSTIRNRSRSPVKRNRHNSGRQSPHPEHERPEPFQLLITNIPPFWNHDKVKTFIRDATNGIISYRDIGFVEIIKPHDRDSPNECLVRFNNPTAGNIAMSKLRGATCNGRSITVKFIESRPPKSPMYDRSASRPPREKRDRNQWESNDRNKFEDNRNWEPKSRWQPIDEPSNSKNLHSELQPGEDIDDDDKSGTYGLSLQFLGSLGLKPPIPKKIFVAQISNEVDEAMLRETFGRAGTVRNVFKMKTRLETSLYYNAKIEFDHPVEAVQAISMFNNQEFCGGILQVGIDKKADNYYLPAGMKTIGPGLGPNGKPMEAIRSTLELQAIKNQINKLTQQIKALEDQKNEKNLPKPSMENVNMNPAMNLGPVNMFNPMAGFGNMFIPRPMGFQGQMQPGMSLVPSNSWSANMMGPENHGADSFGGQGTAFQWGQDERQGDALEPVDRRSMQRGRESPRNESKLSDLLMFSNLPPSVTFQALRSKMADIGEIKFIEMTGKGRAILRFVNLQDAKRCVALFDKSKVDGQVISVGFI